jgi:type I restriction enzyme S subunit
MVMTVQNAKLRLGYKQTEVGVIPEDWEVRRLREIATYKNGKSYEGCISDSGEYFLITLDSIGIDGKLKFDHKKVNFLDNSLSQNDLVMILSDVAHGNFLGLTDVIPENNRYVLNQRVGALKNLRGTNPNFLSNYINLHQVYFKMTGQGSSQQNLTKDDILNFVVLVCIAKWLSRLEKEVHSKQAVIKRMSFLLMGGWAYFARAMRRRFEAMTPRPSQRSMPSGP